MDGGQTLRGTLFIPLVLLMLQMRQLFVLGAVMGIGEVQQYPSIPGLHSPDARYQLPVVMVKNVSKHCPPPPC